MCLFNAAQGRAHQALRPAQPAASGAQASVSTCAERASAARSIASIAGSSTCVPPSPPTTVGSDNLFMASTHVAHDCVVGNLCVLANAATLGGHVELGDHVIMGGFSGVHQFCKIGAHAFIANNAAITRDVPPYVMAVGQPAVPHSVNATGLSRRGFSPEQVRNIKNAFRTLYRMDLPLAEAVERLKAAALGQPEIGPMVEFIARSTRSLVR